MGRPFAAVFVCAVVAAGLASCSAGPAPAWDEWGSQADVFVEQATSVDGSLGAGWTSVGKDAPLADDEPAVTLVYESVERAEALRAACFGDGVIRFGFATRTGSSWGGSEPIEMTCDGAATQVPIDASVTAVRFHAVLVKGEGAAVAAAVLGASE